MIAGMLLTVLALAGMVGWSLHEIRWIDRVIDDERRKGAGTGEGVDGEG